MLFVKFGWHWLSGFWWFWRRRFLNSVNLFSLFRNYLPLEKGVALHLNKFELPSPNGCFVPSLVEISPVVLEKKILKYLFFNIILLFRNCLLLEKGVALYLKKLESLSPKDAFCQVWLNLAQLFLRKRFLNIFIIIYYFEITSPWRRAWPFIWKNLNPLHPRMLCAKFGWNWPSGSGEEDLNVKSLRTDGGTDGRITGQTDYRRKTHLSLRLRWANKWSIKCYNNVKPR